MKGFRVWVSFGKKTLKKDTREKRPLDSSLKALSLVLLRFVLLSFRRKRRTRTHIPFDFTEKKKKTEKERERAAKTF